MSSLPQSGRLRKNCNGSISEPSAFQTVVSNVAYSIPCAPCRGVVPAVHWTPGVILDVLITQCQHTLELLQAEEDLILRFPWAGTLTTAPLTRKNSTR